MVIALLVAAFATPVALDVKLSEFANLTYQLDVVSGQIPWEASSNYQALWKAEFIRSENERKLIELWRKHRAESISAPSKPPAVHAPIESLNDDNDQEAKFRGQGFEARNASDYERRITAMVGAPKAAELRKVLDAFAPRFHKWWTSEAVLNGKPFAQEMTKLVHTDEFKGRFGKIIRFYKSELKSGTKLPIYLMYRPNLVKEFTSGQQLNKYSVVQFLSGEEPKSRIDVLVHELCHYLYRTASLASLASLQQRFLDSRSPMAMPSYNLLNEGLATALGNGVIAEMYRDEGWFAKYLATPRSFYNSESIDAAGKSVFSWIKPYLAKGGSLHDSEFASLYIDSLEKAFGDSLRTPANFLSRVFLIQDEAVGAIPRDMFPKHFRTGSMSRTTTDLSSQDDVADFAENPYLSTVVIVSPGRVRRLVSLGILSAEQADKIPGKGSVTTFWRNRHALTYVVVASSPGEADGLLGEIAKSRVVEVSYGGE